VYGGWLILKVELVMVVVVAAVLMVVALVRCM
jgi:hypothetical protein